MTAGSESINQNLCIRVAIFLVFAFHHYANDRLCAAFAQQGATLLADACRNAFQGSLYRWIGQCKLLVDYLNYNKRKC